MTNAARQEIQERLGSTYEGQRLLSHPHFIGTIHSFFSDFLAKPYLNSKGIPLFDIDDDLCRSQRRKLLQKEKYLPLTDYFVAEQFNKRKAIIANSKPTTLKYIEAKEWLEVYNSKSESERRLGIPVYWKIIDESYNAVCITRGADKNFELSEDLELLLKECIEEVVNKGVLCFSDIFVFSKALMKKSENVFKILRNRFSILFIDEAQDTSFSQAEMLHKLFLSKITGLEAVTRQRFGDANQTIYTFEPPMLSDGLDPYPSVGTTKLTLPVSHRFDQSISLIARNFETYPLDTAMKGVRPSFNGGCNHCVLVFNEDTRNFVIPTFAELLAKELTSKELEESKVKVCSHIHKERDEAASAGEFARTIRDYYSPYIASNMTKEYEQHKYLINYFSHARYLLRETKSVKIGLEKFAEGILRACFVISNDLSSDEIRRDGFFKIKSSDSKHKSIERTVDSDLADAYSQAILSFLINPKKINENEWGELIEIVFNVIKSILEITSLEFADRRFFDWYEDDLQIEDFLGGSGERNNLYRHTVNNSEVVIELKLGTIHSVKGQTHTATLLLESTNRGPVFGQLKPYFLGEMNSCDATGNTKNFLNTLYVGLTRPTHLICLAIPESHKETAKRNITWTVEDFEILKNKGWRVAKVNENLELNFI